MNKLLATLLFLAVLPLPYGYYEILRVAVCLGIIFMLITSWATLDTATKAILIVIALLFNPFSPIYLSKMMWNGEVILTEPTPKLKQVSLSEATKHFIKKLSR